MAKVTIDLMSEVYEIKLMKDDLITTILTFDKD